MVVNIWQMLVVVDKDCQPEVAEVMNHCSTIVGLSVVGCKMVKNSDHMEYNLADNEEGALQLVVEIQGEAAELHL